MLKTKKEDSRLIRTGIKSKVVGKGNSSLEEGIRLPFTPPLFTSTLFIQEILRRPRRKLRKSRQRQLQCIIAESVAALALSSALRLEALFD